MKLLWTINLLQKNVLNSIIASKKWASTGVLPTTLNKQFNYINGKKIVAEESFDSELISLINPSSGKVLCNFNSTGSDGVNSAVSAASGALTSWASKTYRERGLLLLEAARMIRSQVNEISHAETLDTGKPVWESTLDVQGCADTLEYFATMDTSGQYYQYDNGSYGYVTKEPLGVVAAIGAWNYPLQMAVWKSAPALLCGNTMVFKPSPLTPITSLMLAYIYDAVGIPHGVFNVIQGGTQTGEILTCHPSIRKISFTGSVSTGAQVMQAAGKDIKHVTLELGGKSPLIILEDADIDNAVAGALNANFFTQGQVCSNGTRVFVSNAIRQDFTTRLVTRVKDILIGDPFDPDTKMGPLISKEHLYKVLSYVNSALNEGAVCLTGGKEVKLKDHLSGGYFMSPCVLDEVNDDMKVAREEVFGPVLSILGFDTDEEVISRANDSSFGLAAGVFSQNYIRAQNISRRIEAGTIYINNYNVYPIGLPFGGMKKSGIGRENAAESLDSYRTSKSVYVEGGDVWTPF